MKVVTLLSGGLDSTLLACLLQEEGVNQFPIFINYGQINFEKELLSSKENCLKLGIIQPKIFDLSNFGKNIESGLTSKDLDVNLDAFLPNRNALFLLIASSYAYKMKCSHIAIGLLNDKNSIFPDQTRSFLDIMENTLSVSLGRKISILSPLMGLTKGDVISLSKTKGISNTYSCHSGGDKPCGVCISCLEFINSKSI
ncbi:MAG: 7-cyano-7-deazaguanine synthase [Bacteroidales bacterium]|jgi:7-cyano-7-deazaguanine synthase